MIYKDAMMSLSFARTWSTLRRLKNERAARTERVARAFRARPGRGATSVHASRGLLSRPPSGTSIGIAMLSRRTSIGIAIRTLGNSVVGAVVYYIMFEYGSDKAIEESNFNMTKLVTNVGESIGKSLDEMKETQKSLSQDMETIKKNQLIQMFVSMLRK